MKEKKFDFDEIIERRGSGALKYDALLERYGNPDLLPLWVADMDFATPSFIVDALKERMEHPLFGYTVLPSTLWSTVSKWIEDHHNWKVEEKWLTYIPGIVKGIGMVINVFTEPGDKIIIQPPVYHPFRIVPEENGRQIVYNPLIENSDATYSMDFENLEKVIDEKCKILILSNPHNPAGIIWDAGTLRKLAEICHNNNILVISDEIHSDMALFGKKHIPFATVSDIAAQNSITFGAPSKTFNIAGIVSSYGIVPNKKIRDRFFNWLKANEFNDPDIFAPIATIAAFKKGEQWRREMLHYVEDNIEYLIDYCKENIPKIKPLRPDASFLVWLDCRKLKKNQKELNELFVEKAGLALNDGAMFGKEGEGFMRLNVGLPRKLLSIALERLKQAVDNFS
ncbi:MAG: pyridoxal phosphate-dependent aminotransferase [Muribaculaceae bacterium]|nr:pyridoxal phosphate-dependent aminotransferase [Muribaculaceae bacterium]